MATVDERPKSGSINNLSPFLANSRLVISRAKNGDWMTTLQAGYGSLYVFLCVDQSGSLVGSAMVGDSGIFARNTS